MLWGFETILGGWHRLYNWFSTNHPRLSTFFTFDWSKFDKYARHTIIRDLHTGMRTYFDFTKYWPRHTPELDEDLYTNTSTDEQRITNLWNWMTDAILSTPLWAPDGGIYQFTHSGIFSGYLQTQILDSMYNMVMILTILSKMGFDISKTVIKVQGDDSIGGITEIIPEFAFPTFITQFKSYATHYFGAILNDKKSELSRYLDRLECLKYRNIGGMPIRDENELLAMLLFPERSQKLEALMSRAIGIAYANCGNSPKVYSICEDIYNHLKHDIGVEPSDTYVLDSHKNILRGVEARQLYPLDRFPTWFETIQHLIDLPRDLVTNQHWPLHDPEGNPLFDGTPC